VRECTGDPQHIILASAGVDAGVGATVLSTNVLDLAAADADADEDDGANLV
jgi:hypothetical protein